MFFVFFYQKAKEHFKIITNSSVHNSNINVKCCLRYFRTVNNLIRWIRYRWMSETIRAKKERKNRKTGKNQMSLGDEITENSTNTFLYLLHVLLSWWRGCYTLSVLHHELKSRWRSFRINRSQETPFLVCGSWPSFLGYWSSNNIQFQRQ